MDKGTLSNYGWIVIVTLVLSVMLALATPFGKYIGRGVSAIANGLVNSSEIDEDNIKEHGDEWMEYLENPSGEVDTGNALNPKGIIPEGGTYIQYVNGHMNVEKPNNERWEYDDIITYEAGDKFPEVINRGDIYICGSYEYCYGYGWCAEWQWSNKCCADYDNNGAFLIDGWAIKCTNENIVTGEPILETINKEPITSMAFAFSSLSHLESIPNIPNTVTSLEDAFSGCTALTSVPTIPSGVTNMFYTFGWCKNLYCVTINATPSKFDFCLDNSQITEILGNCQNKDEILATK